MASSGSPVHPSGAVGAVARRAADRSDVPKVSMGKVDAHQSSFRDWNDLGIEAHASVRPSTRGNAPVFALGEKQAEESTRGEAPVLL
jgi:hypothetical protein